MSARNGPEDDDRRLPVGERRIGERLGRPLQSTTDHGGAQRAAPVVSGVVEVDLSRHVDRSGGVYDDGRVAVHRALSCLPPGAAVRLRLGRAQWVADPVLDLLAELVEVAASIEVVGSDDRGVAHVVPRLRSRLEATT